MSVPAPASFAALARPGRALPLALAAGVAAVPGFAPLGLFPLPVLALALLALIVAHAPSPRAAWLAGFTFGFGLFAAGVGWIIVALHRFGGMALVLALLVLALFAAYLALWPALACWTTARFAPRAGWLALPAAWCLAEWLRGWVFTGFPWLALGYSQVPWSPLAGLAPVIGVYGVGFAVALSAALLARMALERSLRARRAPGLALAMLWAIPAMLTAVDWTREAGAPITVSLVQGNIAQDLKFGEAQLSRTLNTYESLVRQARGQLVILPETAVPLFRHQVPAEWFERLAAPAHARGGDLVTGLFENDPPGSERYFNAAASFGASPSQSYRKNHLVPFGEYIPLGTLLKPLINGVLDIPLSDQTPGGAKQAPLAVAGQRLAVNICYEDVFGEEIVRAVPAATLLANLTNDAWYGDSWAADQHLQISQMRALEAGRPMLRATNTGVSAVVDHRGRVRASLPQFESGVLEASIAGRAGSTPFAVAGNVPAVLAAAVLFIIARRRSQRT